MKGKLKIPKDLSCLGLGDFDKIIAFSNFPLGTEAAVFKSGAEVPSPVELEEGVAVQL